MSSFHGKEVAVNITTSFSDICFVCYPEFFNLPNTRFVLGRTDFHKIKIFVLSCRSGAKVERTPKPCSVQGKCNGHCWEFVNCAVISEIWHQPLSRTLLWIGREVAFEAVLPFLRF